MIADVGQTPHQSTRPANEVFALTDEQILEIDSEPQDVIVRDDVAQDDQLSTVSRNAQETEARSTVQAAEPAQSAQAGLPVLPAPPAWLAETMNDPQRGAEARALWEGAQRAEREAASYREVFAKPEDARAAAERARSLDDIDRAYFAGDAVQRAQLASMMMREDPAAFREMVFEGLRMLEQSGQAPRARSVADALSHSHRASLTVAPPGNASTAANQESSNAPHEPAAAQQRESAAQQARLAEYAAFERATNEDLERSVGAVIERTLAQALPNLARSGEGATVGPRLTSAIREDVERALQTDRQLGEQVAQILSGKRLDGNTRAQIVRLIGERAQQLVPGAAKRALNDWTQATLAAHRGKNSRSDAAKAGREPAPATSSSRDSQEYVARLRDAVRPARPESSSSAKGLVNYGKLSDEQILDL